MREMEETGKIDDKFKMVTPIKDDKDPLNIHQEICNNTASSNFDNENSIDDNYGHILSNQCFRDESINSKDPDKTVPVNEITLNSA